MQIKVKRLRGRPRSRWGQQVRKNVLQNEHGRKLCICSFGNTDKWRYSTAKERPHLVNVEGRRWYDQNTQIKHPAEFQKHTEIECQIDFKSEEHNYTRTRN